MFFSGVEVQCLFDLGLQESYTHNFCVFQTTSIKVIRDHEGKPKGFGYVQFGTLDGLKEALGRSGESFQGRPVRISVAEPREPIFAADHAIVVS